MNDPVEKSFIMLAIIVCILLFLLVVAVCFGSIRRALINWARKRPTSISGVTLAKTALEHCGLDRIVVRTMEDYEECEEQIAWGATPTQTPSHYDAEAAQIILQSRDAGNNATANAIAIFCVATALYKEIAPDSFSVYNNILKLKKIYVVLWVTFAPLFLLFVLLAQKSGEELLFWSLFSIFWGFVILGALFIFFINPFIAYFIARKITLVATGVVRSFLTDSDVVSVVKVLRKLPFNEALNVMGFREAYKKRR